MTIHIDVEGGRRVARRLEARARISEADILDCLRDAAAAIALAAAERVLAQRDPERPLPSRLAESISVIEARAQSCVLVEAAAPYAVFVELGTARLPAEPFLQPAFDDEAAQLAASLPRRRIP